ncbi:MAG: hypothetical protein E7646_03045 [Ruminococcaceae bacterium]|nr:hypothetical protein [Oscillospiraceae bacterium]
MRKLLSVILVGILILSIFTSCQGAEPTVSSSLSIEKSSEDTTKDTRPEKTDSSATLETVEKTTEEEPEQIDPQTLLTPSQMLQLKEYMPKIDGSTSLIPYEKAIRAALYSKTVDEVADQVVHSTTWGAFNNLLNGETDILLTCPMSKDQYREFEEKNVGIVETPVTKEAFVFIVNANNPVDTLTQQQIKDIYSGKITNWKEVGGNDAEIVAYQRNKDSGSQNFMIDFMGDTPLMDPPSVQITFVMGEMIDVVADNDNGINSIGYSVYSYAADMYENVEAVKFVKVDGVEPSRQTMYDDSYPLLGYNYVVHRDSVAAGSSAWLFAKYALSPQAQLAVAQNGYVPVSKVDYDFSTESSISKVEIYEGVGKGGKALSQKPEYYYKASLPHGGKILDHLNDRALAEEIKKTVDGNYHHYSVYNGYLFVDGNSNFEPYIWNLSSGKRLSLEECFFDGIDIDEYIGSRIYLETYEGDVAPSVLTRGHKAWYLSFEGICYVVSSDVAGEQLTAQPTEPVYVYQVPSDMQGLFDDEVTITKAKINYQYNEGFEKVEESYCNFRLLDEDYYPGAKKINQAVRQYLIDNCSDHKAHEENYLKVYPEHDYMGGRIAWNNKQYFEKIVIYTMEREGECLEAEAFLVFDLRSGEALDWETALFKEGWKDAISSEDLKIYNNAEKVYGVSDSSIRVFYLIEGEASVRSIEIPEEYRVYSEEQK